MDYAPNRRITQKKEEKNPTKWLILSLVFLLQLFFYSYIHIQSSDMRTTISELKMTKQTLKANTNILTIEKERLSSPERILTIARSELNLSTPSANQVFYLNTSKGQ